MKVPNDIEEALVRLNTGSTFQLFVKWLEGQAAEETRRAIKENEHTDRNRGRAQFAMELVETIRQAPTNVQTRQQRSEKLNHGTTQTRRGR